MKLKKCVVIHCLSLGPALRAVHRHLMENGSSNARKYSGPGEKTVTFEFIPSTWCERCDGTQEGTLRMELPE